ncbi:MAG: DUF4623 domain-containing protein [Bacteroidales bacterium]|nr:DUF4623 domain-containing protein [Bacteroidales bacterium]
MKLHHKSVLLGCTALLAGLTSCSDDTKYDNPSGETYIFTIAVSNGGFTGAETINGILDEDSKTIEFTIPAETDIEAVRFATKLSLGASLDKESYDVSTGAADITVVNNQNSTVYHASFDILDPVATPIVRTIQCIDDAGNTCTGFVSDVTRTVYLNCENSASASITTVSLLPRRTKYSFTESTDGKLYAANPGKIELDFLGKTAEYDISFAGVPTYGADFADALVFDNSATTKIWADFEAENTRWAQFDGENFFFLSREGGTNPSIIKWDDVASGSPVARKLDTTGIEGGTFTVSAGGIAHGHFYACNLTTALGATQPLKIYHWADANATCETLVNMTDDTNVKGRWGDNMSVTLDENGNGYLWFFAHVAGDEALRFKVENFTTVAQEPEKVIPPYSVAYYGSINPVVGEEGIYTLTSTYQRTILLVDIDLNLLNRIDPKEGCEFPVTAENDARVINFNGERYMLTTSSHSWSYSGNQTLRVYDLSSGMNTTMAFSDFSEGNHDVLWSYSLSGGNCSAWSANTGAAIGPDGKLRLMAAAPRSGFILVEVDKNK